MIIEIDTAQKTIKVKGSCSVQEFVVMLNKMFPDFSWKSWIITEYPGPNWYQHGNLPLVNPVIQPYAPAINPFSPLNPWDNQPYTGDPLPGQGGTIICKADSDAYKQKIMEGLAGIRNTGNITFGRPQDFITELSVEDLLNNHTSRSELEKES